MTVGQIIGVITGQHFELCREIEVLAFLERHQFDFG